LPKLFGQTNGQTVKSDLYCLRNIRAGKTVREKPLSAGLS